MSKKAYIYIAITLGFLVSFLAANYLYLKHQAMLEQRRNLLCEVLKPNMSKDEVLSILRRVGDLTMSEGDWQGGDIVLSIKFTDPAIRDRYGSFSVVFFDYKYARAVISHGSDNPEVICNFYEPTKLITETPKSLP